MSKFLSFSLMIVTLVIGVVGGYALSIRGVKPIESMTKTTSKLAPTPEKSTIYTDQMYLTEMITHHQDAINMSKQVLEHTSRKEIRALAAQIIEAQSKEITQMKQWLSDWQ